MSTRDSSSIALFKSNLIEHVATLNCPEDLNEAVMFAIDNAIDLWLYEKGYSLKEFTA